MTAAAMDSYDVAVIGGGSAGLSAAVVLGRARRSVVVVDAGQPRNAPAEGVHSFLTRDGISPHELVLTGRKEAEYYGVVIRSGLATDVRRAEDGFEVSVDDGSPVRARRLLVATGVVDELPDVAGLAEHWGRGVVHCPYCHGWEIRDQAVGVLGTSPWAVHQALLFRQWTPDLTLFTHTAPPLTAEQAEQLAARGIDVVHGLVASVEGTNNVLTGVRMRDGRLIARQALTVAPRLVVRSRVLDALGLQAQPHPMGAELGEQVAADPTGRTAVPGVWVAGNLADLQAGVVQAISQGVLAAAAINGDLIAEETARAVAALRAVEPSHA